MQCAATGFRCPSTLCFTAGPFHPKTTFFSHGSWILVFLAKTISVHPYEMFGGDFGPFGLILAELWPLKGPKMAKNTNLHRTFSPRCNVGLVIWGVIPGNLGYFQDAFSKKQKFWWVFPPKMSFSFLDLLMLLRPKMVWPVKTTYNGHSAKWSKQ